MAELHESLLVVFRKKFLHRGYRETKTPMPTYRPDVFAQKISKKGRVIKELIVEAEIRSTLFSNHTAEQLKLMDEYIKHQKRKKIKVVGYLVIPDQKDLYKHAVMLLDSMYPGENLIKTLSLKV